ncbi:MAG: magnesium transporter [Balneolaceae bacterium]|nr:MAG: magnesium transporter [Balneolaceae bacterium]
MQKEQVNELLNRLIASKKGPEALREACQELHPASLADWLEETEITQITHILGILENGYRADVFSHLDSEVQHEVAEILDFDTMVNLVMNMGHDDRVDLLRVLDEALSERVIRSLARAERDDILRLSDYQEGTAGAVMTSDYAWVGTGTSVREALKKIKQEAPDKETIYNLYVLDSDQKLVGLLSLKDLLLASLNDKIEDLMHADVISVLASDSQQKATELLSKYDLIAIPAVDEHGRLQGIITFDDAMDVAEEEATEDFHKLGSTGLGKMSLREAGIATMILKRSPWLLVLVFMNIFSGAGIAYFEDTIEAVVALVFFLPLLIDSGGNAGSQSATLMVRALATGDVRMRDWFGLLGKEVIIALGIGIMMALAVSVIGYYRVGPEVAVVVSSTMILIVLFGSLVGMSLPFGLQKFNFDPATASAPLVTSLADIGGVLIYFSIATWYLGIGLG